MRKLVVNEKFNEKKLNTFLLSNFNGLNINTIYKALRKKDVRINGKRISDNTTIFTGDEITIYISDELLYGHSFNFETIYEDENILLVDKPSGIEVTGNNSLTSILSKKYSYISPCHRLDRNTSGIVLFAKNEISLEILLEKFKNHEIEKHYVCLVYGIPQKASDTLHSYLFKDSKKSLVYISDTKKSGYLDIITSYKIISKNVDNNTSLLDINLLTGRTHQIRAHLAHIGHPIIGDGKYGINEINKKFNAKTQKLCSYSLKFNFNNNNGILDYLNGKKFNIDYKF